MPHRYEAAAISNEGMKLSSYLSIAVVHANPGQRILWSPGRCPLRRICRRTFAWREC
jgi:hypothetical protein